MTTFSVLTGKALGKAIAGYGKAVATFTQKTHQLAFSAINHVEIHHCPSHLNNLYNATPTAYRGAIRKWACEFAKVTFEKESMSFVYNAKGQSDLESARAVSPADYEKADGKKQDRPFDELRTLETFRKKMVEKGASRATVSALDAAITLLKAPKEKPAAKPAAAKKAPLKVVETKAA